MISATENGWQGTESDFEQGEVLYEKINIICGGFARFGHRCRVYRSGAWHCGFREYYGIWHYVHSGKEGITNYLNQFYKKGGIALNKNNYTKEAKFYEQNIGAEAIEKKIDKDRLDIAMKSDWVSIKQAAEILGISYTTLLAMRKEDKADGIQRIPYRGEGKNTRYYVPLLKAYKSKDMDLVTKLAKEIG